MNGLVPGYVAILTKIPENSKSIAAAREHGDLRENSEYKMAKQDQTVLMAQKSQLERELARARVTDFKEATADQGSIGSIIELLQGGVNTKYTVLGAWDSDPANHVISYKTPLGAALLGRKVGETVNVKSGGGEESVKILSIKRYAN